jgi:hypothetical protein
MGVRAVSLIRLAWTCAIIAAASLVLGAGQASADGLTWSAPTMVDSNFSLSSIACPSTSLCVGVDLAGGAVVSSDPTGGPGSWRLKKIDAKGGLTSVSCPSTKLCVAVDDGGNAVVSKDPADDSWGPVNDIDGLNNLTSVSCSLTPIALCVTLDHAGNETFTTNPTAAKPSWLKPATTIDPNEGLNAVSCPTSQLCVAVDDGGNVLVSTEPDANSWSGPENIDANGLDSVSCASSSLCVAVDEAGQAFVSNDPGAGAWSKALSIDASSHRLTSVSCIDDPKLFCAAIDFQGDGFTTSDPAARTWTSAGMIDSGGGLTGVSCPSPALCVATDQLGNVVVGQVPSPPPTNTAPPTISGTPPVVGQLLTEVHGSWTNAPIEEYGLQWDDCDSTGAACAPIPGATTQVHVVTASDVGHTIEVQETATNDGGTSAPATSAPTAVVPPAGGGGSGGGGGGSGGGGSSGGGGGSGGSSGSGSAAGGPSGGPAGAIAAEPAVGHITVKGTAVGVPISCTAAAGGSCNVTIKLMVTETTKGGRLIAVTAKSKGAKRRKVAVSVGTTTVDVPAGQHRTVKVQLNGKGRRLLSRKRHLKVKLIVDKSIAGKTSIVTSNTIAFKAAAKKHKH